MNRAGWDIGGAHLKLALLSKNHLDVHQWTCPLWRGVHELHESLQAALKVIPSEPVQHFVTMTGELVDAFASKDEGVKQILHTFVDALNVAEIKVFTQHAALDYESALVNVDAVASANWLASGVAIAKHCDHALFVDMGSTTTDLLIIKNARLRNSAYSDFERLRSGELIYTGVVRSCVNTISNRMPYHEDLIPLMAENFANMADVYRILEKLPTHADQGETCDGRDKGKQSSMARLARMIGLDYQSLDDNQWQQAAEYFAQQQKAMLAKQIKQFLTQHNAIKTIVAAGVGRFLIKEVATEIGVDYQEFIDVVLDESITFNSNATDCAPAVALTLI